MADIINAQDAAIGKAKKPKLTTYDATAKSLDDLLRDFPYYADVQRAFQSGTSTVELRKRYMLKAIDEAWIRAIEDTLPALDVIIRNPGKLLAEYEEILPVELTRKVTARSVQHLSQHTDYINEIRPDGTVVPSKLLNVFQDDTVQTYENRFINTLLNRLSGFVSVRYDAACECGEDEKCTTLTFHQEFDEGDRHGKINLSIEVSEPPEENAVVRNYFYASDRWRRVTRIRKMLDGFMGSPFVKELGRNFVRPPIMRTNKILKNVDFHQCLELWEFLEQYDNAGYETLIQEKLENVSESALHDFYTSITEQYVLFQEHIRNGFEDENVLAERSDVHIKPKIKDELDPLSEDEYAQTIKKPSGEVSAEKAALIGDDIDEAVRIALAADDAFLIDEVDEVVPEPEVTEEVAVITPAGFEYLYRYSFLGRLILAGCPTQDYYTELKNLILSHEKVKCRTSWGHEIFKVGPRKIVRFKMKGKTLIMNLALNPADYEGTKYRFKDVSDKDEELPFEFKIKADRHALWAKDLLEDLFRTLNLALIPDFVPQDYHLPEMTSEEMCNANPPLAHRISGEGAALPEAQTAEDAAPMPDGITYLYRYSFLGRLILAGCPTQDYYTDLKNLLLSHEKVKSRMSWGHETFKVGAKKIARFKMRGKTLWLYLALNPADYEGTKYHFTDVSEKDADLPFECKVKAARNAVWAAELIEDLFRTLGLGVLPDFVPQDYHLPEMTSEEMCDAIPPLARRAEGAAFPKAEVPTEAPAEETPAPLDGEPAADGENTAADGAIGYVYRYSFMARLIQAGVPTQDYYTDLKNQLLSYKNIKCRTSWGHEVFKFGKEHAAMFKMKGKTLILYLALNPADYEGTKYRFTDVSAKDPELPFEFKIKADRHALWARDLIADLAAKLGLEPDEDFAPVDYHLDYMTAEEMLNTDPPLVKLATGEGFAPAEIAAAPVEKAPVEEAPVEETVAEEAVVEETVVEETVAEETVAEEAPVEETPVEEAGDEDELDDDEKILIAYATDEDCFHITPDKLRAEEEEAEDDELPDYGTDDDGAIEGEATVAEEPVVSEPTPEVLEEDDELPDYGTDEATFENASDKVLNVSQKLAFFNRKKK